ncbi:two-component system response regulator [Flavobacterium sp. AG291]|uniref:response regulator n=1 Tax=Flavobacterium sp. AG291 TaxID=2184000 RepID=UPI000E0BF65F|nr:response regulator [Flavobacterium sp. AG291]RDI09780.1 response regulator receiver domain-containing protein [Flavobacterium sp. AG291]
MKKISNLYVIDDDKIYHFLLKNLFKQNGIDVASTFFVNGSDAIEHIKSNNNEETLPDLILLDVNMPIMNGWQFLEEFGKISSELIKKPTIYMISSSNNEVDINKSKEFDGAVKGYFLKPICKEDLDLIFV